MELKTVGDIVALIRSNMTCGVKELESHAKTLLGPRTRGSVTKLGLEEIDQTLPIEEIENANVADGCECYFTFAPEMCGKLGAIPLGVALACGYEVSIREGEHGQELFLDRNDFPEQAEQVSRISFIVGYHCGIQAVFTWHPGSPLKPFDGKLTKETGVKCHNG